MDKIRKLIYQLYLPESLDLIEYHQGVTCGVCLLPITGDKIEELDPKYYSKYQISNLAIHKRTCAKILIYAYHTNAEIIDLEIDTKSNMNYVNERYIKLNECDKIACGVSETHLHLKLKYHLKLPKREIEQYSLESYFHTNVQIF